MTISGRSIPASTLTDNSGGALTGESWTKNAMVIFDPDSWKAVEICKMRERDGLPRVSCASMGYEDIRIFRTDKGGLQGIAASLHLWREDRAPKRFAEQVLLSFDAEYNVTHTLPIRGSSWGAFPRRIGCPLMTVQSRAFSIRSERGSYSTSDGT